jgi:hypothetical protein
MGRQNKFRRGISNRDLRRLSRAMAHKANVRRRIVEQRQLLGLATEPDPTADRKRNAERLKKQNWRLVCTVN